LSAVAPLRRPAPAAEQRRARLTLVEAGRATAGRAPFVILVGAILVGGLFTLLLLHTMAAQDGFRLHALQRQSAALADAEQQLTVTDQQLQAPSALAARADGLGMVPTGSLSFIRVRGRVVAVASAMPKPAPAPTAAPSAAASPKPSASASAKPKSDAGKHPVTSRSARPSTKPSASPRH
jgi:hypothetical protein